MSRARQPKLPPAVASKITDARGALAKAEAKPKIAAFWLKVAAQSLAEAAALTEKKKRGDM